MHILEDYKAGSDSQEKSKLEGEFALLKEEKTTCDHGDSTATELAKMNSTYLKQVSEFKKV